VNQRRVGLVLCLVSAAGFGSLAVLGKQAYAGGLGVVEVLVLRFGIAGPLLVALAAVTGRALRLPRPVALRLLGLGAVGYAVQSTLFFTALTRISAGLAALLLYLYPALVTVGAIALGRHRLDRATVLGVALALAGVVLVLGLPGERPDPLGVGTVVGGVAVVAGAMLLPLLGGGPEAVGSSRRGSPGDVDAAAGPVVSSKLKDMPRRGSTRR